jgi:hypothetical protein
MSEVTTIESWQHFFIALVRFESKVKIEKTKNAIFPNF